MNEGSFYRSKFQQKKTLDLFCPRIMRCQKAYSLIYIEVDMKRKLMIWVIGVALVLMLGLTACKGDDDNDNPADVGHANALAREGITQLNDVILDLNENEPEIDDENDLMLEATFDGIKAKFTEALTYDANNPMANLGLGILEMVSINYDDELWSLFNDMEDMGNGGKRILNNQFQFLAQAPLRVLTQLNPSKENSVSIMRLQNFIKNSVLPRLDNSITRLGKAVALADSNVIMIDTGEELMEVDCGEIYAFRASVYAVSAAFNMMVAYDMDMKDQNQTYQWIEDMSNIDAPDWDTSQAISYEVDNGTLFVDYWIEDYEDNYEQAYSMQLMGKILKGNMDQNPTFGILTEPARLTAARNALLNAAADVVSGSDYILGETDPQSNDVIKIENILSFNDEDLPPSDDGAPNFTQDWDTIEDICDWFSNFLNNSIQMHENDVDFTVNVSAFFNGAIQDLIAYIPYYHWNNINSNWIEDEIDYNYGYPTSSYGFWYQGNWINITDISGVQINYHKLDVNMGYECDANGNPLADGEKPHFPDYTFNGIFPGMTRAKFLQLLD